jgi:hypothetical protein
MRDHRRLSSLSASTHVTGIAFRKLFHKICVVSIEKMGPRFLVKYYYVKLFISGNFSNHAHGFREITKFSEYFIRKHYHRYIYIWTLVNGTWKFCSLRKFKTSRRGTMSIIPTVLSSNSHIIQYPVMELPTIYRLFSIFKTQTPSMFFFLSLLVF